MKKQVAFYLEESTKRSLDQYKEAMGVSLQTLLAALIADVLAEPDASKLVAEYNASNQVLAPKDETPVPVSDPTALHLVKKGG